MAVGYNPRAITDGLVLSLDAGNPKNYNAGISTNWTDKVGVNNGTLVGGTNHNDGPFVGAGAVAFDGSGDYLSIADASGVTVGTGDFTIEYWINLATSRTPSVWWASGTSSVLISDTGAAEAVIGSSTDTASGYSKLIDASSSLAANTWGHVAVVRSSGTTTIYLNGVSGGNTTSITGSFDCAYIGRQKSYTPRDINGYISNLRIVKGTALYTSNFTPPTKLLTAVPNTVLLTCQGNTISPGTDIVVTTSNKGSGSVGSLSAVTSSGNYYFDNRSASPSTASIQLDFKTVQTGVTQIKLSGGGYAVGALFDLYVNGVLVENDRSTVTLWGEDTITISSTNISSIKIEGSDGYSLGALKFNGTLVSGTITEIVSNGDISLTKEPFAGAGAVKFDGTGDYLSIPDSTDLDFGSGDFTIECWVYPDSGSTNGAFITKRSSTAYFAPFLLRQINTTSLAVLMSTSGSSWNFNQTATSALTTDAWQHVAVTRSGTAIKAFVNGTEVISSTLSGALMTNTQIAVIGTDFAYDLDGKISNLRVVKGTALYTSNFTPPSRTLEPIENTVLLTCQGQNIKDASSSAHTITVNGDAKATIVSSSFEFDGTDDYILLDSGLGIGTDDFAISVWVKFDSVSGASGSANYRTVLSSYSGGLGYIFGLWISGNPVFEHYMDGTSYKGNTTIVAGTWYNMVSTRLSGDLYLYLNGSLDNTPVSASTKDMADTATPRIGWIPSASQNGRLDGTVSDLKIYKGKGLTASEVTQNYNATKGRYA